MKFTIKGFTAEVPEEAIENPAIEIEGAAVLDINFNSEYLVQVRQNGNGWKVINAIDGWGENCYEDFENEEVIVTE